MSIRIRCPECETVYTLTDTTAGKKIRCKKCQGVIAVPQADAEAVTAPASKKDEVTKAKTRPAPARDEEDEPRPKRRRDEDDEDEPRPKKKKGRGDKKKLPMGWII